MAHIVIETDTSLTIAEDRVLSLKLSPLSTNRLTFNDNGELSLKEVKATGYLPLNSISGEVDVPMSTIAFDSACTRLANWNDENGDVKEAGNKGIEGYDGVNLIGLFTALGVPVNVTFWPKKNYAEATTPEKAGWE
jgi:hypothetical protein